YLRERLFGYNDRSALFILKLRDVALTLVFVAQFGEVPRLNRDRGDHIGRQDPRKSRDDPLLALVHACVDGGVLTRSLKVGDKRQGRDACDKGCSKKAPVRGRKPRWSKNGIQFAYSGNGFILQAKQAQRQMKR